MSHFPRVKPYPQCWPVQGQHIKVGDATAEIEYSIKQAAPTVNDSIIGLGGYDVKCFFYPKNEYSWAYAGSPTDVGTYVVRFKVQGNGNYAYTSERLVDESWKNQTKVIEGSTLTKAATIAVDSLRSASRGRSAGHHRGDHPE